MTTYIVNPFRVQIDPMERLLLVNFEQDPDTTYVGFEPQVFDDQISGRGHLVIGWRQDGRVDVYHEAGLTLEPEQYAIAGKGLAHMVECEFSQASFDIRDRGVQAHYRFSDIDGRSVEIRIDEQNPRARRPFGLLAPMGSVAETPPAFPLVLLHDFYFVRRRHTIFEIRIDERHHQPDRLSLPMDSTRMYFARYSPDPVIAKLNPTFDGPLEPLAVVFGQDVVCTGDNLLTLQWSDAVPAISAVVCEDDTWPVTLRFAEGFPDIGTLADGSKRHGSFAIQGHPSTGSVGGEYTVAKSDGKATIRMVPSGGWKPHPTKLSLRFLYRVARVFREWPRSYEWTAIIRSENEAYSMRSTWRRI